MGVEHESVKWGSMNVLGVCGWVFWDVLSI